MPDFIRTTAPRTVPPEFRIPADSRSCRPAWPVRIPPEGGTPTPAASVVTTALCLALTALSVSVVLAADPHATVSAVTRHPQATGHVTMVSAEMASWQADICYAADVVHAELFEANPFPSAKQCAECHPDHFREWSVSPHAYAQLSPVFNAMQNAVNTLTNGTNGDFCVRCHTQVGMQLNEPTDMSQLDRHPTSREGVTCISCHRVNEAWGKGAGRRNVKAGDLTEPVYGPSGSAVLAQILATPEEFGVLNTSPGQPRRGRDIHRQAIPFFQLTTSGFCGACHDVLSPTGFRLEDAFSEYRSSTAATEQGLSCQDCHMGEVPGEPAGFRTESIARVGNRKTPPRRRTNHMIAGPDYSVVHPGIFPHNIDAVREEQAGPLEPGLATMREWLTFDHDAGWGTPEFEAAFPPADQFPSEWQDADRRRTARRILDVQFELLDEYRDRACRTLQAGYKVGPIEQAEWTSRGMSFEIAVSNGTTGHGTPTGFDAERLVYLQVTVWDCHGNVVFQSGDLDPNGDVRDNHSSFVHNGLLPYDRQLFSLQSRFIVRNIRGGEREQILPINYSFDPLPYVRPETRPFNVAGRPQAARKHKQNIEVGGSRIAKYHVPAEQLTGPGPYTIHASLKAGMVPANLVHRVSIAGFDYGLSAAEVARRVVDGQFVLYERSHIVTECTQASRSFELLRRFGNQK